MPLAGGLHGMRIIYQYTRGTAEQIVLGMTMGRGLDVDCSVTFRSSDRATFELYYFHHAVYTEEDSEMNLEVRLPRSSFRLARQPEITHS